MRGAISLCAHPNALPFSSRGTPPGLQVELASALAQELGLQLELAWVTTPFQRSAAGCDIVLDAIVDEQVQASSPVRVSRPYQRSGVALAVRDKAGVARLADLTPRHRVGVQTGSLAHMILERRGVKTVPFGFEDEMLASLKAGDIDGAVVSPASVGYFNLLHPEEPMRIVRASEEEPGLLWNVAVGMRGSDAPLRQKIDAALGRLLDDGTIGKIYGRYGIEHSRP
jgi:polar amino acid transport system substrate-binding protein